MKSKYGSIKTMVKVRGRETKQYFNFVAQLIP